MQVCNDMRGSKLCQCCHVWVNYSFKSDMFILTQHHDDLKYFPPDTYFTPTFATPSEQYHTRSTRNKYPAFSEQYLDILYMISFSFPAVHLAIGDSPTAGLLTCPGHNICQSRHILLTSTYALGHHCATGPSLLVTSADTK